MHTEVDLCVGGEVDLGKATIETVEAGIEWLVQAAVADEQVKAECAYGLNHCAADICKPNGWRDGPRVWPEAAKVAEDKIATEEVKAE